MLSQGNQSNYQPFHTLREAFSWLEENAPSHLINPGLAEVNQVAIALGLKKLPATSKVITVAGSNGKGTTCYFAERIALEHHEKTGLYTSPHLMSFNERIRINGENIADKILLVAFNHILQCCLNSHISLSYFEFTTLCALWCFKEAKCTLIILEVGLGGRLDATNIIDNHCSVITSISLEHQQWLGDSVAAIAKEKAGIIKENQAVVLMDGLPKECLQVAEKMNAVTSIYNQDFGFDFTEEGGIYHLNHSVDKPITLMIKNIDLIEQNDRCIKDSVKIKNFSLAISCLLLVGINLQSFKIDKALEKIQFPGRLEYFSYGKLSGWLDVAHNPEAVANLSAFLSTLPNKVNAVFACLDDKAIEKIIAIIKPYIKNWHVVEMSDPRAMDKEVVREALYVNNIAADVIRFHQEGNFIDEMNNSDNNSMSDSVETVIFGSFVLVGLAKKLIHKTG